MGVACCAACASTGDMVQVRDAFVELHTSPGPGYPVYEIAERGESLQVIKRRTTWYKVRTVRGKLGWVPAAQMQKSLETSSAPAPTAVAVTDPSS